MHLNYIRFSGKPCKFHQPTVQMLDLQNDLFGIEIAHRAEYFNPLNTLKIIVLSALAF